MIKTIIAVLAVCAAAYLYLLYVENHTIFYPMKAMGLAPSDGGLGYEDVFFYTKDNKRLNGWFIPSPAGARGTLVFCHGNAGNISHRLEIIKIFNRTGLNVFIFDYRGYGRSEGRPSERGIYLDAEAAYEYILSRADVDKGSIIIYGESLGCAACIDVSAKVRPRAVILEGGFSNAKDIARESFPLLPQQLVFFKFDNISKIKQINSPILVIHSMDDEIVPFANGQRLYEAANKPKRFYKIRGGHNECVITYKEAFEKEVRSFLDEIY